MGFAIERDLMLVGSADALGQLAPPLGPTWWAEKVGASPGAIQERVERLKASQSAPLT